MPAPSLPGRLRLLVEEQELPVEPVSVEGLSVTMVVQGRHLHGKPARLLLEWEQGGCTELAGTTHSLVASKARTLARLDVERVSGDWLAFLAWLRTRASA